MLGGVAIGSGLPLDDGAEFNGGLWIEESVDQASERKRETEKESEGGQGGQEGRGVKESPLAKDGKKEVH